MPPLPRALFLKYTNEFGLSEYDALNLTDNKDIALFYEEIIEHTMNYKGAANWVMGDVKSFLNNRGLEISAFPIKAKNIAALIGIIDDSKISSSAASQKVFPAMLESPEKDPLKIAEDLNVLQDSNEDALLTFIDDVIKQHPDEVARYRGGEKQLVGFFMGQLMRVSKGQADPKVANGLMRKRLEEQ
jgi:aspartyl-tRNA(Asn)/glutamyl-tRNA(Gln) amidotransferase subunit B